MKSNQKNRRNQNLPVVREAADKLNGLKMSRFDHIRG